MGSRPFNRIRIRIGFTDEGGNWIMGSRPFNRTGIGVGLTDERSIRS